MKDNGFGLWWRDRGKKAWRKTLFFSEKKSFLMPHAQQISEDMESIGKHVEFRFPHVKYKDFWKGRGRPYVVSSKEQAKDEIADQRRVLAKIRKSSKNLFGG